MKMTKKKTTQSDGTSARKKWDIDRDWNLNYSTEQKKINRQATRERTRTNQINATFTAKVANSSLKKTYHRNRRTFGKIKIFAFIYFQTLIYFNETLKYYQCYMHFASKDLFSFFFSNKKKDQTHQPDTFWWFFICGSNLFLY